MKAIFPTLATLNQRSKASTARSPGSSENCPRFLIIEALAMTEEHRITLLLLKDVFVALRRNGFDIVLRLENLEPPTLIK